jgi:hypothetical protein
MAFFSKRTIVFPQRIKLHTQTLFDDYITSTTECSLPSESGVGRIEEEGAQDRPLRHDELQGHLQVSAMKKKICPEKKSARKKITIL